MQRDALGIESIAMHRVNAPLAQGVDTMMDEHSPAERALREAVLSVLDGAPVRDAAIRFGLQPEHVELAISRMGRERGGRLRLRASRTTHAERRSLSADAERALHALLRAGAPAAAGLPDSLWSKSVVRDLIERETGKRLPSRTLMAYL